jgi:hypothetical protein
MSQNKPVYKLDEEYEPELFDKFSLSTSKFGIEVLKENPDLIDWFALSSNPDAIEILEANEDKIDFEELSANPNAIEILRRNIDKINWNRLSTNENAFKLLYENQDKIDWNCISLNRNPLIIKRIIGNNLDKDISWIGLSRNDNDEALEILMRNPEKIEWIYFSSNSNDKAIELLNMNRDKINWNNFCYNPNDKIIPILLENLEEVDWNSIYFNSNEKIKNFMETYNPFNKRLISTIRQLRGMYYEDEEKEVEGYTFKSVFKYDYEKMRKNFEDFEEDLLKAVLHPRRVMRNLELYGYDLDDMFD